MSEANQTVALVRGIPWEGRKWRWCGGLPWPAKEVRVVVVDEAPVFNAEAMAAKQGCKNVNDAVPEVIDHEILAALRNDQRIAVQVVGESAVEQLHKSDLVKLEKVIDEQRKQLAAYADEKAKGADIDKLAHERGIALSTAEAEIVRLKAELETARKRKG